jgi:plasmid maintenance system antidote protein VapI
MRKGRPTLDEQILEAIAADGRSLSELARARGVGPDRLSRLVRGKRTLTLPAAARLCETLGLTLTRRGGSPHEGADP